MYYLKGSVKAILSKQVGERLLTTDGSEKSSTLPSWQLPSSSKSEHQFQKTLCGYISKGPAAMQCRAEPSSDRWILEVKNVAKLATALLLVYTSCCLWRITTSMCIHLYELQQYLCSLFLVFRFIRRVSFKHQLLMLHIYQGGRTWEPFVGGKNGHENFRQARIYNFRDKCVVLARNRKFANSTQ